MVLAGHRVSSNKHAKRHTRHRTLACIFIISFLANVGTGFASAQDLTGNYPWWSARPTGVLSDWYIDENNNGRYDGLGESYDPYGFSYRNCTSYVAWRLSELGFIVPYGASLGHAGQWATNARLLGYSVDARPKQGDVAVWTTRKYGHVAFVESVNDKGTLTPTDDTVNISEYNSRPIYGGTYGTRTNIDAPLYIHFPVPVDVPVIASAPINVVPIITAASTLTERRQMIAPLEPQTSLQRVMNDSTVMPNIAKTPNLTKAQFVTANIDGTGSDEIITMSTNPDGTVSLFWTDGSSSTGVTSIDTGLRVDTIKAFLAGDLNGDKSDDLVFVTAEASSVAVWGMVASNGTLHNAEEWLSISLSPNQSIVNQLIGDINNDQNQDLLLIIKDGIQDTITMQWYVSDSHHLAR